MECESGVETPRWSIVPVCRFCLKFSTGTLLKETVHNVSGKHSKNTLIYSYYSIAVETPVLRQRSIQTQDLLMRQTTNTRHTQATTVAAHWTAAKSKRTAVFFKKRGRKRKKEERDG